MNCGICGKFFEFKCRYEAHKKNINCSPCPEYILNNLSEIKLEDKDKILSILLNEKKEVEKNSSCNKGKIN